jgi:hypothetical protein
MSEETTQADAAALVAMTVADLAAHLDGVDLDTLNAALAQEQAGPNRKGAIAALEAAISGHPKTQKPLRLRLKLTALRCRAPSAP